MQMRKIGSGWKIEHAKKKGKNIVPIILKCFTFPDILPESIDFIRIQYRSKATDIAYSVSTTGATFDEADLYGKNTVNKRT